MVNEFKRIDLACDTNYIVPHNIAGITTGLSDTVVNDQQVCTLTGAVAGQNNIPGRDYVSAGFAYSVVRLLAMP